MYQKMNISFKKTLHFYLGIRMKLGFFEAKIHELLKNVLYINIYSKNFFENVW